jgi:archaellin
MLLPLLMSLLFVVAPNDHLIEWKPSARLTWEDFKATPDYGSENVALTNTSIQLEYGYDKNSLEFTVKCRFDKTKSWVKIKNDDVLQHEQLHFDIAELYARKLRRQLRDYKFNAATVAEDVNNIYMKIMEEHHSMQQLYDAETDHSRLEERQAEWVKRVESFLGPGLSRN